MKTANRLDSVSEYVFSDLMKKVKDVEKRTGRKVLNLGPGSPDFKPSKIYIDKLSEFIREPVAHLYPGFGATREFSEALINWYKKRFNVEIKENELLPLNGAKDGISHFPLAFLNKGDEFLVPDPGYSAFSHPGILAGAKPIPYSLTTDFKIDLNELEKLITSKTKFIWINFPSNPTGQVITKEELIKIVNFVKNKKLFIAYDNAYSEITFDGFIAPSILEINRAKDVSVEFGSFSKTFSFAGYRMGWIVGNGEVISGLAKIKSHIDSGLSLPLQRLGAYALNKHDKNWHENMIKSYFERRNIIAGNLKKIGLGFDFPKGGLYLWAKIPDTEKNSEEFALKLLEERQIFIVPGTAYGKNGERYVRISICTNIDNINDYF